MRRTSLSMITLLIAALLLVVSFQPVTQVDAEAAAAAAACGSTYTVQSGDTLTGIAFSCGVTYAALRSVNLGIVNPDLIFPGQVVNIPSGIPNTGGNGNYTVKAGDTLWRIAQTHGTTVAAIAAANPAITNVNLIFVGQVINVPGAGSSSSSNSTGASGSGNTSGSSSNSGSSANASGTGNNSSGSTTGTGSSGNTSSSGSTASSGGTNTIPNTGSAKTYTVQAGDTLWNVSNRFGTTVVDIMKANPSLTNMNLIYPGQVLTLP